MASISRRGFVFASLLGAYGALAPQTAYADETASNVYFYDARTSAEIEATIDEAVSVANMSARSRASVLSSRSGPGISSITDYAGDTRFDTAAMQARAAYDRSEYVIVVGDGGWPDALAATGLAGILDCPILLTARDGLSSQARSAISDLGASRAVVLGGPIVISDRVASDLRGMGLAVDRLAGDTRRDTQMMVYEYGASHGGWSTDMVAFASGERFHDALSFAPVAYALRVPVFLVDGSGSLEPEQRAALQGKRFATTVVLGGPIVMGDSTVAFANSIAASGSCTRLAGDTRYDTSADVAQWSVDKLGFSWDGAAFTTASLPYDALAGGVLQGKERSVILLVDDAGNPSVTRAAINKGSVSSIKFFGGHLSISPATRSGILRQLGNQIVYTPCSVSFERMYELERQSLQGVNGMSQGDKDYYLSILRSQLDPFTYSFGDGEFYQFAKLDSGHSGLSKDGLNAFIATYGADGKLANQGQAFIDAANTYGVNEAYLLSHAILESGWGKSQLASGFVYDGSPLGDGKSYPAGTYYNFFGIGAVDSSPLSGGRAMAVKEGWDSPHAAILGAAKWISAQYVGNGYGPQNTLYRMKWDIYHAERGSTPWKQYATSPTWATGIASVMASCFSYNRIELNASGLAFEIPVYSS